MLVAGADFLMLAPKKTFLQSSLVQDNALDTKPVDSTSPPSTSMLHFWHETHVCCHLDAAHWQCPTEAVQQRSRIGCKVALLEQVVAVTAVQTGAGKSQVAAYINEHVRGRHLRTSVVRHPMPYGAPLAEKLASRAGPKQPSHGPGLLCLMKS